MLRPNFFVKGDDEIFKGKIPEEDAPFSFIQLDLSTAGSGSLDVFYRRIGEFVEIRFQGGFVPSAPLLSFNSVNTLPGEILGPAEKFLPVSMTANSENFLRLFIIPAPDPFGNLTIRGGFEGGVSYQISTPILKYKI